MKAAIARRAAARYAQEQAAYAAKQAERAAKEPARGRKLGGKPPQEPPPGPRPPDQVHCTGEDARLLPVSGGGVEPAYHAHATVAMATVLIGGTHVRQPAHDKQEVEPALQELVKLPDALGQVDRAALATGYYSQDQGDTLAGQGMEPVMAVGRHRHSDALEARLAPVPEAPPNPEAVSARTHRLTTTAGNAFSAKRHTTLEPVFGLLTQGRGFRRFLWRGWEALKGEWRLVGLAFNLKRLCVLMA